MIFINLPVKNLPASKAFFQTLGYAFDPRFENDTAACLVIEEGKIHSMLMTHAKFAELGGVPPTDPMQGREVLLCVSLPSRDAVDQMMAKALAAGATLHHGIEDEGFMYGFAINDLDGHAWQFMWMDTPENAAQSPAKAG